MSGQIERNFLDKEVDYAERESRMSGAIALLILGVAVILVMVFVPALAALSWMLWGVAGLAIGGGIVALGAAGGANKRYGRMIKRRTQVLTDIDEEKERRDRERRSVPVGNVSTGPSIQTLRKERLAEDRRRDREDRSDDDLAIASAVGVTSVDPMDSWTDASVGPDDVYDPTAGYGDSTTPDAPADPGPASTPDPTPPTMPDPGPISTPDPSPSSSPSTFDSGSTGGGSDGGTSTSSW